MSNKTGKFWIAAWIAALITACGGGGGGEAETPHPVTSPPPRSATVDTLQFSNTGFTEVEIHNSFAFIVQQGDRFGVTVEIDAEYSHLVSVTQNGIRLVVEFDPAFTGDIRAEVARGVITLPEITELRTDNSAFVDIAAFTQSYLRIRETGSSHVAVSNSRVDFIDVNMNGNSHLSTTDMAAIPAVNVEMNGSSQATLKMMDGGTMTGTAAGSSNVSYYGSSVSQFIETFNTATVTWLGPARN